jgi:hypothetical protein
MPSGCWATQVTHKSNATHAVTCRGAGAAADAFLRDLVAAACKDLAPGEKLTARAMWVPHPHQRPPVWVVPPPPPPHHTHISLTGPLSCHFHVPPTPCSALTVRKYPKFDFLADVADFQI